METQNEIQFSFALGTFLGIHLVSHREEMKNHGQFRIFLSDKGQERNWIMLTIILFQSEVHPASKSPEEKKRAVLQLKKNFAETN